MSMTNILPVPEGSAISVYNVLSYSQYMCRNKRKEDTLFIVYRDESGKKKVHEIIDPAIEIYFVKPEYRNDFTTSREYYPIDKVNPVKVKYKKVIDRIYDEVKTSSDVRAKEFTSVYWTANNTGQWTLKKELHKWPYVLMSDMDAENYYWVHLGYHYNLNTTHRFDRCFADIENDVFGLSSAQTKDNEDPVNACTLIFCPDNTNKAEVITHLLRNHTRYPQQKDFENRLSEFYQECHKHFDKQSVIKDDEERIVDTPATYKIVMHDDEKELLKAIFDDINKRKPDVCEFWNMPYDMPKMKGRMEKLNMDPVDIMSDKDLFPKDTHFSRFHIDNRPIDISNRNSYIRMTSTTLYMDQMQNYAGIRKGRKAYGSNKLDNIAKIELGMGKWEFPKGIDVTNAAIYDYWDFVLYNIRDVWCQVLIDNVTSDTMSIIYDMNQMNCPAHLLVKQTKYQRQIYYTEYLRRGHVPGNNINVNYSMFSSEDSQERALEAQKRQRIREALDKSGLEPDEIQAILQDESALQDTIDELSLDVLEETDVSETLDSIARDELEAESEKSKIIYADTVGRKLPLPGGLVGNPDYNSANGVELMPGHRSKHIFDTVLDEDYSSEYPWAKYTRSLSRSTQIGRLIIPEKVSDLQCVLPLGQEKRDIDRRNYIPGAEFTSDYISQDYLSFGTVWFNLPSVEECSALLDELLSKEGES